MGKALKIAVVAVGVGAGVLVGASYWSGNRIEEAFRARAAEAAPFVAIEVLEYDRGLFGARAKTVWKLRNAPLTFVHDIRHGPLAVPFELGQIHSELLYPDNFAGQKEKVRETFAAQVPLVVDSRIRWGGEHQHRFTVARFDDRWGNEPALGVHWEGAEGEIAVGADTCCLKGQISFPGLTLELNMPDTGLFQLKTGRATFTLDGTRSMLKAGGELPFVSMSYDNGMALRLEKLNLDVQGARSAQYRYWTGNIDFGVGKAALESEAHKMKLVVDNYRETLKLTEEGPVLNLWRGLSLDRVSLDSPVTTWLAAVVHEPASPLTVDKLKLGLALENLDAEAIDNLIGAIMKDMERQASGEAARQSGTDWTRRYGKKLLSRHPAVALRESGFELNGAGDVRLDARLAYVGGDNPARFNPLTDIATDLHIEMSRALLFQAIKPALIPIRADIVRERAGDGDTAIALMAQPDAVAPDDAEIQQAALELKNFSDQLLVVLIDKGWVEEHGDKLQLSVRQADGALILNGKPVEVNNMVSAASDLWTNLPQWPRR
jgi:uncharacterized protein YdgA (DUF945 family)